jgi:hypothetical protein
MSQVLSFNASSASTSPSQPASTCRGNKTNKYTAFALYTRIHLSFFASDVRLRYGSNIAAARQTSAQSPSHNSTSPRFTPLLPPRPERQPHPRRDAGRDSRIRRCHRSALELAICAMGPLAFQSNLPTHTPILNMSPDPTITDASHRLSRIRPRHYSMLYRGPRGIHLTRPARRRSHAHARREAIPHFARGISRIEFDRRATDVLRVQHCGEQSREYCAGRVLFAYAVVGAQGLVDDCDDFDCRGVVGCVLVY